MKKILSTLLMTVLFASTGNCGELSESEREIRTQARNDVMTSYRECSRSSSGYLYWKKVIECSSDAETEEEKYLCLNQSSHEANNPLTLNCKLFYPTREDIHQRIEYLKSKKLE